MKYNFKISCCVLCLRVFVFRPDPLQSLYSAVDNLRDTKADRELVAVEVGGVSALRECEN